MYCYDNVVNTSSLNHVTKLLTHREDLENVSPPSQGQFLPEPGGGGDVHLLSSYYEQHVFDFYLELVATLKTWNTAIGLQNLPKHIFLLR